MQFPSDTRVIIDNTNLKSKKIKKVTSLRVIDLTNVTKSPLYDTYVVDYSGKLYYISPSDVVDNTLLDTRNKEVLLEYDRLQDSVKMYSPTSLAYNQLISSLDSAINERQNTLELYKAKSDSLLPARIQEAIEQEIQADIVNYKERRERYMDWISTLPTPTIQNDAKRLAILSSSISVGYYGLCSYTLSFINMSKKTIKYLTWYGKVKNAVGDYISCEVKHTSSFSGKYTGPCEAYSFDDAYWEPVLFNSTADQMVLSSVKINYTDGTSVTITGQSLGFIMNVPKEAIGDSEAYGNNRMYSLYEDPSYADKARKDKVVSYKGKIEMDIFREQQRLQDTVKAYRDAKQAILTQRGMPQSIKTSPVVKKHSILLGDPVIMNQIDAIIEAYKTDDMTRRYKEFKQSNFIE